ncbi:SDR family NAD(P)-dependent oxidoreductase [Sulfitobacter sp. F26204]|uniref:SDR family NAD(P)-dependent oxidoreductase n=1 Tax=Sulfitobacter sp. F26204 TaxID=2996014 RepID=UPI00225E51DB|nr:SDR family NAD(P)-dependent oxidoreductase [Sulfitobacter sp. F26204]MCX7560542.1 SDR family NAD(P)-dependent oxidoreductase [Sulfitobacter sp. F26204]
MSEAFLKDRVCIVTGGTRGIGRAIAEYLARNGAKLAVTYRGDETAAQATRTALAETGAEALVLQSDLTSSEGAKTLLGVVQDRFGRLDALINNAGRTFDGAFAALELADYEPVVDTNLLGTIRLALAAVPMLRKTRGNIVNLSSLAAVSGKEGQVVYSTTKGGINGMTRMLARHLGTDGIRVNSIAPGFIRTDMVNELPESAYSHILDSTALRDMGNPEDVAKTAAFLASEMSSYVNGSVIRIDGGFHR